MKKFNWFEADRSFQTSLITGIVILKIILISLLLIWLSIGINHFGKIKINRQDSARGIF
ncbi:MAG TPA: hypothetical protein VFC41_01090 [Anaerovoracaceae bacterium]|nr:hypothetical protein [Anaerovoracaceae bacterium]